MELHPKNHITYSPKVDSKNNFLLITLCILEIVEA